MPGMTPLMVVASEGSLASFEVLMEFNPDINLTDLAGRTALHYACRAANIEVARALMDCDDIEVDIQTNGGTTPLMCAVESGNAMMVVECLNHTCSPFAVNALGEKAQDLAKKFEFSQDENNIYKLVTEAIEQWQEQADEDDLVELAVENPSAHFEDFKNQ